MIDPADPGTLPPGDGIARLLALARALGRADLQAPAIATTPKDPVWRSGKTTLYRYRALAPWCRGPVLIVHGLIGRQTVTDLEPDRSLVQRLLAAGVDVWVIDWGNATRADRFRDFTDFALHDLGDALGVVERATRARVAVLGVCQGGVFAACHAALHPGRLAGLILAVTPIDFHVAGLLGTWCRGLPPALIDRAIDDLGVVPGAMMGAVFRQLAPVRAWTKYTADLAALAQDPAALETFLRMEVWLADRPDHPGAAARQWLVELYGQNALVAGRFALDGVRVDLGAIDCPVLGIVGAADHIVPPASALALAAHLRPGLWRALTVPTGHAGVFVARSAQPLVAPAILDWLAAAA